MNELFSKQTDLAAAPSHAGVIEGANTGTRSIHGLRPFVTLTPEACGELLRAVKLALETFRNWGVPFAPASWLGQITSSLERVVLRGSVGDNEDELRQTSAAVAAAVDLYHISTCLGDQPHNALASELVKLTEGRLLARDDAKSFLSQFWFGCLLAQSKLNPRFVAYDRPFRAKPDFLLPKAGVDFAVEVKRPRSQQSAGRSVLEAGRQLRDCELPGIIVVDATDCMTTDPWGVADRSTSSIRAQVSRENAALHRQLRNIVHSYSRSNKFHQTAMLITFARSWGWIAEPEPKRDAGIAINAEGFSYLWSSQITGITRELQVCLMDGIKQLTGNTPEYSFL